MIVAIEKRPTLFDKQVKRGYIVITSTFFLLASCTVSSSTDNSTKQLSITQNTIASEKTGKIIVSLVFPDYMVTEYNKYKERLKLTALEQIKTVNIALENSLTGSIVQKESRSPEKAVNEIVFSNIIEGQYNILVDALGYTDDSSVVGSNISFNQRGQKVMVSAAQAANVMVNLNTLTAQKNVTAAPNTLPTEINPSLTISKEIANLGETIDITGNGFTANGDVWLYLIPPSNSGGTSNPLNLKASNTGTFSHPFNTNTNMPSGSYRYSAEDRTSGKGTLEKSSQLTPPGTPNNINPSISVSPSSGGRGTSFTFAGSGFTPDGRVEITESTPGNPNFSSLMGTPTIFANAQGTFQSPYVITSNTWEGVYSYNVKDLTTNRVISTQWTMLSPTELPLNVTGFSLTEKLTPTNTPFSGKFECVAFGNYGEGDRATDILYPQQYGVWNFNSSTQTRKVLTIRGAWADSTINPGTSGVIISVNNEIYFNGNPNFKTGQPSALDSSGNSIPQNFTNFNSFQIGVNTKQGQNTIHILNKNSIWLAIDWLEVP